MIEKCKIILEVSMIIKKVLLVVIDGLGIGSYENDIYNSLFNAENKYRQAKIPTLEHFGLNNLIKRKNDCKRLKKHTACIGRTKQQSIFCESFSAHWEMTGIVATSGHSFKNGIPHKVINKLRTNKINLIGNLDCHHNLSNIPKDITELHIHSGNPIVVTMPEEIPITTLGLVSYEEIVSYEKMVSIASEIEKILSPADNIGRIVIKTFNRIDKTFKHLVKRTDIPIFKPPTPNLLDAIIISGRTTMAAGKISEMFNGYGFTRSHLSEDNPTIFRDTLTMFQETISGLIWTNFNSLDRPYGHDMDVKRWIKSLELFDNYLNEIINKITCEDLLIVTGDHGCDPVLSGFHTKEWNPLLIYNPNLIPVHLSDRSHSDIAATISDCFSLDFKLKQGKSFYNLLRCN